MTVLAVVLLLGGAFFLTVSCIGIIRLPDFYTRSHAAGKSETLGAILLLGGLAAYNGFSILSVKILLIVAFVLLANPAATHAILRAASRTGLEPWTRKAEGENSSDEKEGGDRK